MKVIYGEPNVYHNNDAFEGLSLSKVTMEQKNRIWFSFFFFCKRIWFSIIFIDGMCLSLIKTPEFTETGKLHRML